MRDLVIAAGLLALIPMILKRPWIGVLAWTWIAIASPHQEAFGFSISLRPNLLIVAVTLMSFAMSAEKKEWPGGTPAALFIIFMGWTTIATVLGPDRQESMVFYKDFVIKMALHMVITLYVINSKHRLQALVWVFCIALGWHAVKIAMVTIKDGGVIEKVGGDFGPKDSFITDRNHFALAMLMMAPLLFFIVKHAQHKMMKLICIGILLAAVLSVIGSQSRGGFMTMLVMFAYLWWKSKKKIVIAAVIGIAGTIGFAAAPPEIKARISTVFEQFEEGDKFEAAAEEDENLDESFCLRIAVWQIGFDMTKASPILGNGLRSIQNHDIAGNYTSERHVCSDKAKYGPRAAHNIYVEAMTDSGFVGLMLFVGIIVASWASLQRTVWRTKGVPELLWAHDLASMVQVSLIAYAAGGMLLSLAYYDGYYIIVCMAIIMNRLVREHFGDAEPRRIIAGAERRAKKARRRRAPA